MVFQIVLLEYNQSATPSPMIHVKDHNSLRRIYVACDLKFSNGIQRATLFYEDGVRIPITSARSLVLIKWIQERHLAQNLGNSEAMTKDFGRKTTKLFFVSKLMTVAVVSTLTSLIKLYLQVF